MELLLCSLISFTVPTLIGGFTTSNWSNSLLWGWVTLCGAVVIVVGSLMTWANDEVTKRVYMGNWFREGGLGCPGK